jgi:hypothetical protein
MYYLGSLSNTALITYALEDMSRYHNLFNMALLPLVFLLLFQHVQAQFIQHYNTISGSPHWRRQVSKDSINRPVLQPAYPVYLQYNCWKMPAICNNARSWMNDATLPNWNSRAGQDVFTYDNDAGVKSRYNSVLRPKLQARRSELRTYGMSFCCRSRRSTGKVH